MIESRGLWMRLNNPNLAAEEVHVAVIGVPYDGSVTHDRGASEAPSVLRELSSDKWPQTENFINLRGLKIKDFGDVDIAGNDAEKTLENISKKVSPLIDAGAIPVVLGGDHSITSAVVRSFNSSEEIGILWFDSHYDLMDTYKGLKGKEESKWNHACPLRRILELPHIKKENLLVVGVRDYILEEHNYIIDNNIETIYAKELYNMKPETVIDIIGRKFEKIPKVYMSIDIDILDPAFAPGTGVPIPGGISTRFMLNLVHQLFKKEREYLEILDRHFFRLAGFDIVEISPPHDVGKITSLAGISIIMELLGYVCLQEGIEGIDL